MKQLSRALAFVLALLPAMAAAQTFPTVPSNTVIGRTAFGTGPAQAIPFSQITAQICNLFTASVKGCVPPPGAPTGRFLGDDIAWHAAPTQQVVAGTGISVTGTCSGTSINCTVNASAATQLVLPSRAAAAGSDLSLLSSIKTLGYTTPGDGGGATFVKTAASAFLDNFVATGSITTNGTSGCTNGTYLGQVPNGMVGFQLAFNITVAGNIVTAITNTAPGNGLAAGTVLTFTVPGCAGSVTWTIATITAATGSFTDAAGNKWQIVYPAEGLDARAMGVKMDWSVAAGDAGSTDNFTTLQNAINFAAYSPGYIDTGASNGGRVNLPRGTALFCGSNGATPLKVWNGVALWGQSATASVIKPCDAWINTTNFIELCDSLSHVACFSAALRDLQVFTTFTVGQGSAVPTTQAVVYTNSCQHQGCGVYNATIYPGACRIGVKAESGFGGAAMVFLINEVEIKGGMKDANCGASAPAAVSVSLYVSTIIRIDGLNIGGLSAASTFGPRSNGLAVSSGFVLVDKLYAENVVGPIIANISGATNGFLHVKGFDAGTACVNGVLRAGGSTANTVKLESAFANSCTNTYNNAGAGSGGIVQLADVVF